jgi:hypothetical protein
VNYRLSRHQATLAVRKSSGHGSKLQRIHSYYCGHHQGIFPSLRCCCVDYKKALLVQYPRKQTNHSSPSALLYARSFCCCS